MRRRLKLGLFLFASCVLLAGLGLFFRFSDLYPYQNGEYIPANLDDAHRRLLDTLPEEEIRYIRLIESEDGMIEYHQGLGRYLRNSWGLWRGSRLARHLHRAGFRQAEDMSAVILETFWCRLHDQPYRLEERAEEYRSYWENPPWLEEEAAVGASGPGQGHEALQVPPQPGHAS